MSSGPLVHRALLTSTPFLPHTAVSPFYFRGSLAIENEETTTALECTKKHPGDCKSRISIQNGNKQSRLGLIVSPRASSGPIAQLTAAFCPPSLVPYLGCGTSSVSCISFASSPAELARLQGLMNHSSTSTSSGRSYSIAPRCLSVQQSLPSFALIPAPSGACPSRCGGSEGLSASALISC